MPLIKSGSRAAISTNISEMVRAGHPRNQAIAAALSTARRYRKRADGGELDEGMSSISPLISPINQGAAIARPIMPPTVGGTAANIIPAVAAQAHEQWRSTVDPNVPRVKQNSDGTSGNINVPFDQLHPYWQQENLNGARAAYNAVQEHGNTEAAASQVHDQWMQRNPKNDYNASQHIPYEQLSDVDKERDRFFVRAVSSLMPQRARGGEVKLEKAAVNYREGSGGNRCANCTMFRNPNACTLVGGYISPHATCDRFDAKEKRATGGRTRVPDLILIRHGATRLNAGNATSVDHIRGWKDVPLSDEGKKEAEKLAQKCKSLGIEVMYSSDLSRAHETAKTVGNAIGIKPVAVKGLRPWDLGEFTGQNSKIAVPKILEYLKTPDKPIPSGESFNSFRDRTFSELKAIINRHPGKRIALVTHHRVERLLKAWQAKGEPANHNVDPLVFGQKGEDTGHAEKFPLKNMP